MILHCETGGAAFLFRISMGNSVMIRLRFLNERSAPQDPPVPA